MKYLTFAKTFLALAAALGLAACSGGGETGTGVTSDRTVVVGPITGFGSVHVNGIRFETDSDTTFMVNGAPADESALAVGMVVTVQGTVSGSNYTATAVSSDSAVRGVVTNVADNGNGTFTLTVLGQAVLVTLDTVFRPNGFAYITVADLTAGAVVEVSGHASDAGAFRATYVKVIADSLDVNAEIQVRGVISSAGMGQITIGSLTVTYDGSTTFEDLVSDDLAPGLAVEVEATGADLSGGQLYAREIERLDDDDSLTAGTRVEIEGVVITGLNGANEFNLSGRTVRVTHTLAEIQPGVRLEVHGQIAMDGVIEATSIEVRHESEDEIEGLVTAIDAMAGTLTIDGSLTVRTTDLTRYEDEVGGNRTFSFADISIGDLLEIEYYFDTDSSSYIATSIETEDGDEDEN